MSQTLSPTYREARQAFLAACAARGVTVSSEVHPLAGLEGEELAVDVAEIGPADAHSVVVIVSATHGVEGYAGSALQTRWLRDHIDRLPSGVAVVMVHALNPFGMSWVRRVNENNVDLNRNFVDWTVPPPHNTNYDGIADDLVPTDWSAESQEATTARLLDKATAAGLREFQTAVSSGQFHHPTGIFYGGTGPVWSHAWLRGWFAERMSGVSNVAIIDLHTGLGAWGAAELMSSEHATSLAYKRSTEWWGDVISMFDGDSVSAVLLGDWLAVAEELAPHVEMTAIAIEYGTVDIFRVLQALRADAWLHAHGDPRGANAVEIRAAVRAAFADDDPSWLATLWPPFESAVNAALDHLPRH
jgi:Protein of unknown function (DUF2817)